MTDFYNRYRNLFSLNSNTQLQYKKINDNKPIFTQQPDLSSMPYFSALQYERKPVNYINFGRSSALDQFQKQVLPKFSKPYPEMNFHRLKTQIDQNSIKMNSRINKHSNIGHQFYQLPKVYSKLPENPVRQRIMTEGGEYFKKGRNQVYNKNNMAKQIQYLQKQYLGRAYPNEEDRIVDRNEVETIKLKNSHQRVLSYNQPFLDKSRVEGVKDINRLKKWEIKILPSIESRSKYNNEVITPREADSNNAQFKLYESRQKQLYGLRQNQYAFVNDKLNDIKKAEKYYPRGYINSYRQALFRRKNAKNHLEQRKMKLKMLLSQQEEKYGLF